MSRVHRATLSASVCVAGTLLHTVESYAEQIRCGARLGDGDVIELTLPASARTVLREELAARAAMRELPESAVREWLRLRSIRMRYLIDMEDAA